MYLTLGGWDYFAINHRYNPSILRTCPRGSTPLCRKFDAHTLLGKTTLKERLRLVAGTLPTYVRSRTSTIRYLVVPDSAWSQIICIEGHPVTSTNHEFQMNFTDEAYYETRKPAVAVSQSLALQLPPLRSPRNGVYQKSPASDGPSTYFPWKKSSTSWFMFHWKSWKYVNIAIFCHILWDSIAIQATRSDIEIFPSPHPMASHDGAFRPWERRVAGVSGAVSSLQGPVSCQWIGSVMGFLPKKRLYIWWQKPWFIMVSCWFFHEFSEKKQSVDLGSKEKRGTKRDRTGFSHQWVYHKGQRVSTVIVFPVGVKGFHLVQQVLPKT